MIKIKPLFKRISVGLSIILLTSCATFPQQDQILSNKNKKNIHSTRILLNTNQREIILRHNNIFDSDLPDPYAPVATGSIVRDNSPPYTGANPIGMLFGSGVQFLKENRAQNAMPLFTKTLKHFDFPAYFNNELKNKIATLPWLKVQKQELKYNIQKDESEIVAASTQDTTLFIGTTYALNSTLKRLEVAAYVKLVKKSANQTPQTLYIKNFFFINRLPEPTNDVNANKARWLRNDGALLKTKLLDASSLLSSMIAMDLQKVHGYKTDNRQLITFRSIDGFKVTGRLIKRQNGYYIFITDYFGNKWQVFHAVNSDGLE